MRRLIPAAAVAALLGKVLGQDSDPFVDPLTGLTFSRYVNELGVSYAIAVPKTVADGQPYDAVVQMTASKDIGWFGLAWGGTMTYNPLTVAWANGDKVVLSSRMATGFYAPPVYETAKYTVLPNATFVNTTHVQVTARCSGCTTWGDADVGVTRLDPKEDQYLAFAFSHAPVDEPSNPESNFNMHDMTGHWVQSFAQGANAGL